MSEKAKRVGVARPVEYQLQPTITQISRQLQQEALPLYYSKNVFDFENGIEVVGPYRNHSYEYQRRRQLLQSFREAIGDNTNFITTVQLGRPFQVTVKISNDQSTIAFSGNERLTEEVCQQMRNFFLTIGEKTEERVLTGLDLLTLPQTTHSCSSDTGRWK